MKGSTFKYSTQWYEMNHLRQTAHLQQELMNGTYKPTPGRKFKFSERGKTRYITSNCMDDKTVNHNKDVEERCGHWKSAVPNHWDCISLPD